METNKLKQFAQSARRQLRNQVSAKIEHVLKVDSIEAREKTKAVKHLQNKIAESSKERVIDQVAYTWFNRFCALRFMDVNRYTFIGAVSPAEGYTQPEILAEAKQGHIDDDLERFLDKNRVFDLLNGSIPSNDPQSEAYRLLLVGVCNYYNMPMPFLFEKIDDYTELLMPDDLLSENSILAELREALTPDSCMDVEVIGWLYQFYISEKKDEIFDGLKKNKKITPENIPAATQLFTPNWIVRYLVENSLGRLWMLNHPQSRLAGQMEYYIKPDEPEADFLSVSSPEELRICDPACGSGHMLVYAFDILYAIYEEEGYESSEIPEHILSKNLYGVEIDERAAELAAFALTMKARSKYKRFLGKPVQPNICILVNIKFEEGELETLKEAIGEDHFSVELNTTLRQFEEANNFGSLIQPELTDVSDIKALMEDVDASMDFTVYMAKEKAVKALSQADYLSPKYHIVIANPPYMGGKGMNPRLGSWAKDNYPNTKSDLFSMFIERTLELLEDKGFVGLMTPFVWMFLSSYEKIRKKILESWTLSALVKPSYTAFFQSAIVPVCAYIIHKFRNESYKGCFIDLEYLGNAEEQPKRFFETISGKTPERMHWASATDFKKIPGSPIAYWVSDDERNLYQRKQLIEAVASPKKGLDTGENEKFLRYWYEVSYEKTCMDNSLRTKKWYPYNKGGEFRKWYGNREYVINWKDNGAEIKSRLDRKTKKPTIRNSSYYFKECFSWTTVSSGGFSARYCPPGALFDNGGCSVFSESNLKIIGAFLNSKIASRYLEFLSPTLNFQPGDISKILFLKETFEIPLKSEDAIRITKEDWDTQETSWDFETFPMMICTNEKFSDLKSQYALLRQKQNQAINALQRIEEENNQKLIEQYKLGNVLPSDVPREKITLFGNPECRYNSDKSYEELENLLLVDTLKDLISYSVGCMFGRYSLDKPGLILANQGDSLEKYSEQINTPSFHPDNDNVIPILDDDWFTNDITTRFKEFLTVTFGEEHFSENIAFIEEAIGKDIRKFFRKDFYNDHIKRYKKRPIYWLFSSPKGSFNTLIYMHRYQPDTVSVVLNDYLREYRTKLTARKENQEQISISGSSTKQEKARALKEIDRLKKIIDELNEYETEILYPLATQKIEIDLDDGVKVNYNKFGKALKHVPGLSQ